MVPAALRPPIRACAPQAPQPPRTPTATVNSFERQPPCKAEARARPGGASPIASIQQRPIRRRGRTRRLCFRPAAVVSADGAGRPLRHDCGHAGSRIRRRCSWCIGATSSLIPCLPASVVIGSQRKQRRGRRRAHDRNRGKALVRQLAARPAASTRNHKRAVFPSIACKTAPDLTSSSHRARSGGVLAT
jgi:hypothetical protein